MFFCMFTRGYRFQKKRTTNQRIFPFFAADLRWSYGVSWTRAPPTKSPAARWGLDESFPEKWGGFFWGFLWIFYGFLGEFLGIFRIFFGYIMVYRCIIDVYSDDSWWVMTPGYIFSIFHVPHICIYIHMGSFGCLKNLPKKDASGRILDASVASIPLPFLSLLRNVDDMCILKRSSYPLVN